MKPSEPATSEPGGEKQVEPAWLLSLRHPAAVDSRLAGSKAASLARLLAAGMPVPEGYVLTTGAYVACFANNQSDSEATDPAAAHGAVPEPLASFLAAALASLGEKPLAIRSSGVAEDLAGASFAGQYDTVLDVRGRAAILEAIGRCWASSFNCHLASYMEAKHVDVRPMAVLIQPMVEAEAAGVAFTANPVTGSRSEVLVSAVKGLGEKLVSGEAIPDEWTVRDGEAICRHAPEDAISVQEVLAVAKLARQVEEHAGSPQDIEWAIGGGKLYLLQARPITTLPDAETSPARAAIPIDIPPGFWERETSHFPQPLTPMFRSFILETENLAFRHIFDQFSLLLETLEVREIGGWMYQRLVPLGGKDRRPPPRWLWPLLIRLAPPLRKRIRDCAGTVRAGMPWKWVELWYGEWKPWLIRRTAQLRAVELTDLTDEELIRHVDVLGDFFRQSFKIHMMINGAQNVLLAKFFFTCRDLLGWDEARAVDLLSGLSDASSAPARALAGLAGQVRDNPRLHELLLNLNDRTVNRLDRADPGFAAAFGRYIREFGCRPIRYELSGPTVAETPRWVLRLLRDQLRQGYDPARDAAALAATRSRAAAEARAALAVRPDAERMRFEKMLSRARQVYPLREEHGFYDSSAPMALMRYAALEIGSRLVAGKQISRQEDVFFLEVDEAKDSLADGGDRHGLVKRRRDERAWALAHPGPASYGDEPPPPPSFAALPGEARFLHEAIMWTIDRTFAIQASSRRNARSEKVTGIAASGGAYTGPARIIMGESEFDKIQAGDVLVCPITSPVWSILFPSVSALVTDSGGILSHSAIIAREYRIPAVVATGNATELLRDGQMVRVDGGKGIVEVRS
ncbi:MAG: hypothetical protein IBX61_02290 [Thermoleophilia bacterium]|nr:hypothetical protein [Thermoleophilia bacterium]